MIHSEKKYSKPLAALFAFANWFLPGLGFLLVRDYRKGIGLFLIINGLFVIGLAYNGYVYPATFNPKAPDFNIVASLTLIAQMCHGLGSGLLLFLQQAGTGEFNFLLRDPGTAYSDVGAFHILVAGILNYFASMKLYDDLTGYVDPEIEAKEKQDAARKEKKEEPVSEEDKADSDGTKHPENNDLSPKKESSPERNMTEMSSGKVVS